MLGRSTWVQLTLAIATLGFALPAAPQPSPELNCDPEVTVVDWQASPELLRCVEEGDVESLTYLALLHLTAAEQDPPNPEFNGLDRGLTRDVLQSEGWSMLVSAAESGSLHAPNEIGLAYLRGSLGQSRDYEAARHWFEMGVQAGDTLAPYNLARLYHEGLGVEPSRSLALAELWRSVARGYPTPLCQIALLVEQSDSAEARRLETMAAGLRELRSLLSRGQECRRYDLWTELSPPTEPDQTAETGAGEDLDLVEVENPFAYGRPGLIPPNGWNILTTRSMPQFCVLALGLHNDAAWEIAFRTASEDLLYAMDALIELTNCGPYRWY